jgi:RNA polymerase sigma-32 factor
MLAKRWEEHQDPEAAAKLVTSHLRLVAKIAMGYRGYGLPVAELISEGNIGLMQGVKKFEPEKGFRLATYAMWWIKASIQEYILRSWSLVKIGTTAAQKKLFFNLRRMKGKLDAMEDGDLRPDDVEKIATDARRDRGRSRQHEPAHVDGRRHRSTRRCARKARANGRTGWPMTGPLQDETDRRRQEARPCAMRTAGAKRWTALNDRERTS